MSSPARPPAVAQWPPALEYQQPEVTPPPPEPGSTAVRFQFDIYSTFDAQAFEIEPDGTAGLVLAGFGAGFRRVRRAALGTPSANGCYELS